jgi:hypothetical protein
MPKENRPTLAFVFLVLMGLLWCFISDVGIPTERLIGYGVCLAFEVWAIANKRKGDTISEGFWELSARPLVPFVCGVLFTYYVMNGTITNPVEIGGLMGLAGHFFWQADQVYRSIGRDAA